MLFFILVASSVLFISKGYAGTVDIRLNINFKTNEALIDIEGQRILKRLYFTAQKYPNTDILISGHTDNIGSSDFNKALSLRRAEAVEANLFGKGVKRSRMKVKGFGESEPIDTNETPEGRYQNRRVVASIFGLTDEEEKVLRADKTQDVLPETPPVEVKPVEPSPPKPRVQKKILVTRPAHRKFYITGFMGPNFNTAFYGGDLEFQHASTKFLSFGVDVGYEISKNWFADAYLYYLPAQAREGTSGIDFAGPNVDQINYENNIYGFRVGRYIRKRNWYRLSLIGGLTSHIIGGIKRETSVDFKFAKFQHIGLTLGIRHEQKISKSWVFDSDLAYLFPISVDNAQSAKGRLWYRGILGVKKRLNNRWRLGIEYQVVYHQTSFEFSPNIATEPEFFIQTVMAGLKYKF